MSVETESRKNCLEDFDLLVESGIRIRFPFKSLGLCVHSGLGSNSTYDGLFFS